MVTWTKLNQEWHELIKKYPYASLEDLLYEDKYRLLKREITGTWRWGQEYREIWTHDEVFEVFGVTYRVASGDSEIEADDMQVRFFPVKEKQVMVIEYEEVI